MKTIFLFVLIASAIPALSQSITCGSGGGCVSSNIYTQMPDPPPRVLFDGTMHGCHVRFEDKPIKVTIEGACDFSK